MTQRTRSPVLGYNHNLRRGGRVYHVQTEDSGVSYARVYTHLFFEGTILSSKKQEYDPASTEDAVRSVMQQLHKAMIRELTHGGHDPHIVAFFAARGQPAMLDGSAAAAPAEPAAPAAAQPEPAAPAAPPAVTPPSAPIAASAGAPAPVASGTPAPVAGTPAPVAGTPGPIPVAAPASAARTPAPRPKPVVVVKPGGVKRPPVVLSSSADGVVVRRNVVINVGAGAPPVNGSVPPPAEPIQVAEAPGVRPRAAAPIAVREGVFGNTGPAPRAPEPAPRAAEAVPQPQPLASSREIHMPWETSRPPAPAAPVPAARPVETPAEAPVRASRQIRMPWDPPAPAATTESFASDLVNDKSLDEVILEYLSDDPEPEQH